jgi:hypothetical protein
MKDASPFVDFVPKDATIRHSSFVKALGSIITYPKLDDRAVSMIISDMINAMSHEMAQRVNDRLPPCEFYSTVCAKVENAYKDKSQGQPTYENAIHLFSVLYETVVGVHLTSLVDVKHHMPRVVIDRMKTGLGVWQHQTMYLVEREIKPPHRRRKWLKL